MYPYGISVRQNSMVTVLVKLIIKFRHTHTHVGIRTENIHACTLRHACTRTKQIKNYINNLKFWLKQNKTCLWSIYDPLIALCCWNKLLKRSQIIDRLPFLRWDLYPCELKITRGQCNGHEQSPYQVCWT